MNRKPRKAKSKASRDWLTGGGEMGKLIREMDWSKTPLGPIDQWPQSLRTTVSLCLASNFPISIAWGPQRAQIYNDGYWPICGAKHPHSMGQDFKECWFSAWPVISDAFERASSGEAAFIVNQRMFLDRNGYLEETFFTFSFSPIRDESGGVGGLFHPVTEMTQQTLGERRLKVLRDLADRTAEARTVASACELITSTLATHKLDLPFALLYLLDADGQRATLAGCAGLETGTPASPEVVELNAPPEPCWPLAEAARSGQAQQVDELERRFGPLACGPYSESPQAAFTIPINVSGLDRTFGLLVAGVSSRRALDEAYRTFYAMLTDGVTTALTGARAYEEERKRAEALAEIDRAKTVFFSNVSHEFRTPLTLMLGPLEDILAEDGLPPGAQERLEAAHRNSLRLLKLVNMLLDFSRIEAGRIEAAYEPTDLATFTADLASAFRSMIERAGIKLVVDCPPLSEPVYVDREMWEKIVLNLLSNAFKFTFEGEIEVRLRTLSGAQPGFVELTVRDTGAGIPKEEAPRLFERFHRIKGARGRSYEGSGIGLALVHELVRLHGGEIRIESEVDRGSKFTVMIPMGPAHLPADRIGATRSIASTGLRGEAYIKEALRWLPEEDGATGSTERREIEDPVSPILPVASSPAPTILLADDNTDMRDYIRRLLSERYQVVAVADGEAALEAARECTPELVLADVMMPRLDGFGLLKAMRADERTARTPVILLSARAGEESRVEGLKAGADDYLVKPFSAREMLARVEAHLNLHRARREAEQTLRESESRFREMIDALPAAIYTTDAEGRLTHFNPAAAELSGRMPELGTDCWCVSWKLYYPDGAPMPHDECPMAVALNEGRVVRGEEVIVERPDGSRVWFEPYPTPLRDSEGGIIGGINMLVDITERKRAEIERDRASRALRESEEQFRALVTASSDVVYRMSPDWKERRRLSGRDFIPDTESPSHDWLERYIPPDDRPRVMAVINEAIRNRSVFELEHRVIRADGATGWAFSRAIPLPDAQGEIVEWLGAASDVTRQRMAENALRARHERARLLADISARLVLREIQQRESAGELMESVFAEVARHLEADKYFYFFADDDEPETLRLASSGGINAEQRTALSTIRFSDHLCGAIARTRSPLVIEDLQNHQLENASAIRAMGATAYAGYPMIADGRLIGVISFAATRRLRFADEELELIQTVADLLAAAVERDRLNNAVRESEERFRNLADNMSQFAWIADAKGWLFWYNRRWYDYTGTTLEEMQGWGWKKVHHPDHVDRVVERIQRSWDTGETWEDTFPLRGKDGDYRWFLSRAVPIRDAERKIVRWFGTNTDITEQRQAEEEIARLLAEEHRLREMAEQATRAKDEFLAVVSHELRSPLNAILGWNHLLQSKRGGDPHIAKVTETIERSGKTQLQLIEDLLDMTRIITGKMKLESLPVELGAVILSALDTVRPAANNKGIDIMLSIDPKAGQITGDPDRLQQVVWNLVSNAIKFTPEGGRVWVEALRGDAGVQIVVRDTGQGVAPDLLPYVFDRFRQGDASAARRFGGLGLGLALVKHMVELHGGRVVVESPGEGLGATFTVNLPIRAVRGDNGMDGKAAHGQYAPLRQRAPGLEGLRALVVDDEAGARELLAATLELHGVLVTGVGSTDAALAEIESRIVEAEVEPFDVLISDIGMPDADGYELIRRVRAHPDRRVSRLRAVALTAYARSEDRLRALRAGFYMHVPKPVDEEELTTVITALMGGHSR